MFRKPLYNIVMASDNNYFKPLIVTVYSLLQNKDKKTRYQITILIPGNFDRNNKETIIRLVSGYRGCKVAFVDMAETYNAVEMKIAHITTPTFYRLKLPEIISATRCLYLDVDVIVRKDLRGLFETDMGDNYVAGVKAASYYKNSKHHAERIGIPALDNYVNAGVLLMNLDAMRRDNLVEAFDKEVSVGYKSQDQDIINKVCYGKILVLPPEYNSMTKYKNSHPDKYDNDDMKHLQICYTKEEWIKACTDPYIIHYADKCKPWDSRDIDHADEWWKYADDFREKGYIGLPFSHE